MVHIRTKRAKKKKFTDLRRNKNKRKLKRMEKIRNKEKNGNYRVEERLQEANEVK